MDLYAIQANDSLLYLLKLILLIYIPFFLIASDITSLVLQEKALNITNAVLT